MKKLSLTAKLKQQASEIGFALVGVCPAVAPASLSRFDDWLAAGYAGEMSYLPERRASYDHPRSVLDGVRSIAMLAMNYRTVDPAASEPGQGRIARYAWGACDYHDLIHDRLHRLARWFREQSPQASVRGVVDTAPLLERDFAQLAGLGWIGKNTLLLNRNAGSYFFLAALLTDVKLDFDTPHAADHCGTCTACLDACPTAAFPQPYVLNASRCISYLTIEHRSQIPDDLRPGMGDWLFGCDICQEVCPWNGRSPKSDFTEFAPLPECNPVDLIPLFDLDDSAFRARFRNSPLWRPKRRGLLRNAAIVLGNNPTSLAIAALVRGLNDDEPLIRGACAWALGKHSASEAKLPLTFRWKRELDAHVREEIESSLAGFASD